MPLHTYLRFNDIDRCEFNIDIVDFESYGIFLGT